MPDFNFEKIASFYRELTANKIAIDTMVKVQTQKVKLIGLSQSDRALEELKLRQYSEFSKFINKNIKETTRHLLNALKSFSGDDILRVYLMSNVIKYADCVVIRKLRITKERFLEIKKYISDNEFENMNDAIKKREQ